MLCAAKSESSHSGDGSPTIATRSPRAMPSAIRPSPMRVT
jgi:hypothetical protein